MNRMKRLSALLVALLLLVQGLPLSVLAQEGVFSPGVQVMPQATAATPLYHTVLFYDDLGNLVMEYSAAKGNAVLDGTPFSSLKGEAEARLPAHTGFAFSHWTPAAGYITADAESTFRFYAVYTSAASYEVIIHYEYEIDGVYAGLAFPPYLGTYGYGESFSVPTPSVQGYVADQRVIAGTTGTDQNGATRLEYIVKYHVDQGTPYQVRHLFQAVTGSDYVLNNNMTTDEVARSGALIVAYSNTVTGFTPQKTAQQVAVAPDGSTKVDFYYDRNVYILTYDVDGGTYVAPFRARYESPVTAPEPPTRQGYQFMGWSLDGKTAVSLPATLTESLHYTALWQPLPVDYTVMYWLQMANALPPLDASDYEYSRSLTRQGFTGDEATYDPDALTFPGFDSINTALSDVYVSIQGDGSTIKNVYVNRLQHKLTFYDGNVNHILKDPNTGTNLQFSVSAGASTKYWFDLVSAMYPDYNWNDSTKEEVLYTYAPTMPDANLGVFGKSKGGDVYLIHYLEQGTNKAIVEALRLKTSGSFKPQTTDYVAFPGYTFYNVDPEDGEVSTITGVRREFKLWYSRNTYHIQYYDRGDPVRTIDVKYDHSIPQEADTYRPPTNPGDDYEFAGWYTTQEFLAGTQFQWMVGGEIQKMPAHDLVLYARWVRDASSVHFTYQIPGGAAVTQSQTVPYGGMATWSAPSLCTNQ